MWLGLNMTHLLDSFSPSIFHRCWNHRVSHLTTVAQLKPTIWVTSALFFYFINNHFLPERTYVWFSFDIIDQKDSKKAQDLYVCDHFSFCRYHGYFSETKRICSNLCKLIKKPCHFFFRVCPEEHWISFDCTISLFHTKISPR